ncbi:uncharacterized protein LOC116120775 [Pistacia vera]|uniref:uncharacterized protein LOC116120775 n=1 Tax=Pistacia vera TaxID=55513 RepID=UPI00126360A0|nr:uncharacterized protein LOC116120775 [Pistacia vera]
MDTENENGPITTLVAQFNTGDPSSSVAAAWPAQQHWSWSFQRTVAFSAHSSYRFHSQYEEFRFQVPGHEPWHSIEGRSRGGGMVDKERLFSHRKLTETVFVTAAQGALALFTFLFAPGGGSTCCYMTGNLELLQS